jgi:integrase
MAYADKRDGKLTGSFVGEAPKLGKKRRFKTMRDAKDYETFCKLMGREPPTIDDGLEGTGAPTFAQVAEKAKKAGGPKGKWLKQRDHSIIQRIDYCVGIIGPYEVHRIDRAILKKIPDSLERAKAPGKKHMLSAATKNRYMAAAGAVLTYAVMDGVIQHKPMMPLLDEKSDRKERDILQYGQDEVVLKIMREEGHVTSALCVEALIETGLRSGELLHKLRPDQIVIKTVEDEEGTEVTVGILILDKGQTKNNSFRKVLMDPDLAKQIRALIAAGKMPTSDVLLNNFKSACKRAGYEGNLVIHSLRHTRNTRLRKAGVDRKIRKELLGHMSDAAHDIYDHTDLEDQLEVVKKVKEYAGKRAKRTALSIV